MKICFIATEIFAWGKYGGFGRATRMLAKELTRRGHEVSAVVPLRQDQQAVEWLDGIKVFGFPLCNPLRAIPLFRHCQADIYHSQQPSISTWLAQWASPQAKHVITFRDPKGLDDWWQEVRRPSLSVLRTLVAGCYENNPWVNSAIRRADALGVCAQCIKPDVERVYQPTSALDFLPNPIAVPVSLPKKARTPTVCFVGRWDKRKRPERFLALANDFPQVHFIAAGASQNPAWDAYLRDAYGGLANVSLPGFIDQFRGQALSSLLATSHIMVNTSTREGLPTAFLEALAHGCALVSSLDPEQVVSRYGAVVENDDYKNALAHLLANEGWRAKGEAGRAYVNQHYELNSAINAHENLYQALVSLPISVPISDTSSRY